MTQLDSPPRRPAQRPSLPSGATAVPRPARTPQERDEEAADVRFRRALTLLGLTLVLPGSAQLLLGRKAIGRVALRVWLGCWALLLLTVVTGLLSRGFVFWVGLNPVILGVARLALCALAVGWALLFLDAWRDRKSTRLNSSHANISYAV